MIGLAISMLLIFGALVTMFSINCFAVLTFIAGARKLDWTARLGASVVFGIAITISVLVFNLFSWNVMSLFLLAGITGICFTTMELNSETEKQDLIKGSYLNSKPRSIGNMLFKYIKSVVFAIGLVLCLLLILSLSFVNLF